MKHSSMIAMMAIGAVLTGCQSEESRFGEGSVNIVTSIDSSVKVVRSRADVADEASLAYLNSTLQLWITQCGDESNKLVRQYQGAENLPVEPLPLLNGSYIAEAWAGDSVSASWSQRYFKAYVPFSVNSGQTTTVDVKCTIANVAASIKYSDDVVALLDDCTIEVGHNRGHLTFDDQHIDSVAYFMMPSTDKHLHWTLKGTKKLDGVTFTRSDSVLNVKPGYQYVFNVSCAPKEVENVGGAFIRIEVDEEPIVEVNDRIEIETPPIIEGYAFDIDEVQTAMPGGMEHKSVWIFACGYLKSVLVKWDSEYLTNYFGTNGFDYIELTAEMRQLISDKGIMVKYPYYPGESETGDDGVSMKMVFDDVLLQSLPEGEYNIRINATDSNNRKSSKTLQINITDATLEINPVDTEDIRFSHSTAVLTGKILKTNEVDAQSDIYFEYWTSPSAKQKAKAEIDLANASFSAHVTGLTPGTKYYYAATIDGFTSLSGTFTTEPATQLPNSGFEDWQTSSTPYLIYPSGGTQWWDSGNHGSATMKKNVTVPDESVKHSGSRSIKLASQFVGVGSIGKFAAGNVFIGEYLDTDGTDGVLGWGRPFTGRPSKIKAYVKYAPVNITDKASNAPAEYVKGQLDKGIIYAALLDDNVKDYKGKKYPVIIKTKTTELFDKNGSNVIAYGEKVFAEATGDNMVEVVFQLDYKRTDIRPSYILLTASASKGGDYFTGGNGSNMWIDDIELIYE